MNYAEDTFFNLCFLEKTQVIYFSEDFFYHYRRGNEASLSRGFHENIYQIFHELTEKHINLLKRFNCSDKAIAKRESQYLMQQLVSIYQYYYFHEQVTDTERLNLLKTIVADERIKKQKIRLKNGIKINILLMLFKLRLYKVMDFIFKKKYTNKNMFDKANRKDK